ncbi:hypothetical protein WN48_08519 [Eufriesea mexicana]|uniref:Uncharacterized protein n=1 Tax=Eufriesea mexicana TaxID=516756 RepID=A0A310ST43_9HYME|nr:hypothetical protein WN48_08519 [Eufriesea mexicana]
MSTSIVISPDERDPTLDSSLGHDTSLPRCLMAAGSGCNNNADGFTNLTIRLLTRPGRRVKADGITNRALPVRRDQTFPIANGLTTDPTVQKYRVNFNEMGRGKIEATEEKEASERYRPISETETKKSPVAGLAVARGEALSAQPR